MHFSNSVRLLNAPIYMYLAPCKHILQGYILHACISSMCEAAVCMYVCMYVCNV